MKLTSREFHSLRQAVKVADAQRELVELTKKRRPTNPQGWQSDAGLIAAALGVIFVITLASLTQPSASDSYAYRGASEQQVVLLD
jgi:hypothetical protein